MIASPLRYPGGKAKLYGYFAKLIEVNNLYKVQYCEPYAGGAGLAIKLLTNGFVQSISLNDIDKAIYSFWHSALHDTDRFCQRIIDTPISIDQWHHQKNVWMSGDATNTLDLGFAAYFLNRTNRSGIIEGAGPIGGYAQASKWKLDARFVKDRQITNIKLLSKYKNSIKLTNLDALEYLDQCLSRNKNFVYLDPPYYLKGCKLYKNFYNHEDHVLICKKLEKQKNALWAVSYDDVPQIREIYNGFFPIVYNLNYSAGEISTGREVMYLSNSVRSPKINDLLDAA